MADNFLDDLHGAELYINGVAADEQHRRLDLRGGVSVGYATRGGKRATLVNLPDLGSVDVAQFSSVAEAHAQAVSDGRAVRFPPGTHLSDTITLSQPVVFDPGAVLQVNAGQTVTVTGEISGPANQPFFDGAGAVNVQSTYPVHVLWWAGATFADRFNACMASLTKTVSAQNAAPVLVMVRGTHDVTKSLLATRLRRRVQLDFRGSRLNVKIGGALTGDPNLTFSASGKTITRSAGSWLDENFAAGKTISVRDSVSNNLTNALIADVTGSVLTLDSGETLVNEGPSNGIRKFICNGATDFAFRTYGFCNFSLVSPYITSTTAPHITIDSSSQSVTGVFVSHMQGHSGTGGVAPAVSVLVTGTGLLRKIRVTDTRRMICNSYAFKFDSGARAEDGVLDWGEDQGLLATGTTLEDFQIHSAANKNAPIVLGTKFTGDIWCGLYSTVTKAASHTGVIRASDLTDYVMPTQFQAAPSAMDPDAVGATLLAWYDCSDAGSRTLSGSDFTALTDLGGLGNNATAIGTPQLAAATQNGLDMADCAGTADAFSLDAVAAYLTDDSLSDPEPLHKAFTVIMVAKCDAVSIAQTLFSLGAAAGATEYHRLTINSSNKFVTERRGTDSSLKSAASTTLTADTDAFVISSVFYGSSEAFRKDAVARSSDPRALNSDRVNVDRAAWGCLRRNTNATWFNGKLGEFVLIEGAASAYQVQSIELGLIAKWGL